jgi:hypothetical protein
MSYVNPSSEDVEEPKPSLKRLNEALHRLQNLTHEVVYILATKWIMISSLQGDLYEHT